MRIIPDISEMQSWSMERDRAGERIAVVPTMGALHEGHRTLLREGRKRGDKLILTVFVNPSQFGPNEDLSAYPRTFEADCEAAEAEGADIVFAPRDEAMYPEGYQTWVRVDELSKPLCGAHRPVHFGGVATIVLKLFNICRPAIAVFGWKDAQQFILLRRMVADLNLPVEMVGIETVRESDGLAMSSRNKYLTPEERAAAPAIYRGLQALRESANAGERDAEKLLEVTHAEITRSSLIQLQYLEMRSIDRLEPLSQLEPENTLVAVAAQLGKARLIDNIRL